jgi:hypothetical protein
MQRSDAILADRDLTYPKSLGHLGGEHRELREGEMFGGGGNALLRSQGIDHSRLWRRRCPSPESCQQTRPRAGTGPVAGDARRAIATRAVGLGAPRS